VRGRGGGGRDGQADGGAVRWLLDGAQKKAAWIYRWYRMFVPASSSLSLIQVESRWRERARERERERERYKRGRPERVERQRRITTDKSNKSQRGLRRTTMIAYNLLGLFNFALHDDDLGPPRSSAAGTRAL